MRFFWGSQPKFVRVRKATSGTACLIVCLLLMGFPSVLHAQNLAAISGVVTDASGASVPDAQVTVTNNGTRVASHVVTTSAGTYILTDLTPGTYTVKIEKAGFTTWVLNEVNVYVGSTASADVTLKTGAASDVVEVTASPITLETTQPEYGAVIENKVLEELPNQINGLGRQIDNFLFLAPGVTGGGFSHRINGGLDFQNEVVFNGVVANQSETRGFQQFINPPYELVGEFKVLTSVFSAQYGLGQGVATYQFKSGTNAYHGDAFEILRNSYFDARDVFTIASGSNKPPVNQENNYGVSFGGPVSLPKVYDGKDKTFFHVSYERFRLNSGANVPLTVPTQAALGGDFTGYQPIFVPNGYVAPAGCLNNGAAPVAGQPWFQNKIPTSCFSQNSQALLSSIPAPNTPIAGLVGNYLAPRAVPTTQTAWGFSIDHDITDRQKIHGTFYRQHQEVIADDDSRPFPGAFSDLKNEPRTGTGLFLNYSNAITSNLVVTGGFSWLGELNNEFTSSLGNIPAGFTATSNAIVLPTISFGGDPFSPSTFGPVNNGETFSINRKLGLGFNNNWLYTHGRHNLNFGLEVRRSYQDDHECQDCGGSFNFSSNSTSDGLNFNSTGSAFASFLLGTPDSAFRHFAFETKLRNIAISPYVQDNIKVTSRLTVDAGLRWDIERPFTTDSVSGQPANQIVFFDPTRPNPGAISNATGQPLLGAANVLGNGPGTAGYSSADTRYRNFSPRLGLAYKLNDKTVILSGFALNFLGAGAYEYGNNKVATNYGNVLASNFNVNSNGTSNTPGYCAPALGGTGPSATCTWDGAPVPVPAPLPFGPTIGNANSILSQFGRDRGQASYVQTWNVAVQRELPSNLFLSVAYIGNKAVHLTSRLDNPNQVNGNFLSLGCVLTEPWTATVNNAGCNSTVTPQSELQSLGFGKDASGNFSPYANFLNDVGSGQTLNDAIRPFPQFFGITDNFDTSGTARYDALQAQLQKRFSSGLSFLVAYTLSKDLTNADSGFSTFDGIPLDKANKKQIYTIASNDQTHVLTISGVYELPIGPGKRFLGHGGLVAKNLIGGWQLSGVFTYASGTPYSVGANGSPIRTGNIANLTGQPFNVNYNNYYKGLPIFDLAAFSSPGVNALGNSPRNLGGLRGPFSSNENFALAKRFYFNERVSAELRMEFSNIFNRVLICTPDTNVDDGAQFGIINGGHACQNNSPRQGQAYFKVNF